MKNLVTCFLLLISFFAVGQQSSINVGALRSKVTDSTTVATPSGYGVLYYNNQSNKWRVKQGSTWYDMLGSGGGGFADPMTTRGDIIFRNSSNVTARLGRGTANQVLTSDGTDLSWGSPSWASITGKPNLIELPYAPTSSEDGSSIIWNDTSGEWEYYAPTYYSFGNGISTSTLGDIGLQVDRFVGATTETINIAPAADNTHDFNIGYCCGGFLGSKRYGYVQLFAKDGISSRAGSDATTYTVNSTGEYGFTIQNYSTQGVTSMVLSNGASGKVFIMEVPRPTKSPTLIMDSIKSEFRNHRLTVKGVGLTSSKTLQLMNNNGTERFAFTDGGKFSVAITPANDDTLTQVLVRDGSSGEIKYRSASSLSGGSGITIGSTAITGGTAGRLLTSGTTVGEQTLGTGVSTLLSTPTKANFNSALSDGDFLFVGDVTQYTDEQAQDAIGSMVDASLTYVDGTPLLQRAALTGAISASAGSNSTSLGSFTKAQLDGAVSDGNVLYVGDVTTNATHTGEVTGSGALTVDKTAITNKTLVTASASDHVLIADASDSDNLKKVLVSDLTGGGGITNGAAANELMKSDGTNAVASGAFSATAGDITLGTSLAGAARTITADGSATDVDINLVPKGTGGQTTIAANASGTVLILGRSAVDTHTSANIAVEGTQTNISLGLLAKNAGSINLSASGGDVRALSANAFIASNATGIRMGESSIAGTTRTISTESTSANVDIVLTPKGSGNVKLGTLNFDADQVVGAGVDNYILTYDNASGLISLEAAPGGGSGLTYAQVKAIKFK